MTQFVQILGEDLTYALGWTFVHTVWQGSLIALIMMLVLQRTPVRHAARRYAISMGSMVVVLIAAVVTFAIVYPVPGDRVAGAMGYTVSKAVPEAVEPSGFTMWIEANMPILVTVWLVGMLLLLVRFAIGLTYLNNLRRSARTLGEEVVDSTRKIAGGLGVRRIVTVAESAKVSIPVVIGFVKPLVLFPLGAVNQLSLREVEAVLAHELAHIARNDFVHNLIQSVIEIIFYYHPAVWWISAVVRAERENCCDDLAVKTCGDSITYARVLVQLQELGRRGPALALPLARSKSHLLNRVKRILDQPQNKSNAMEKLTATLLLVACLIFASFSAGNESAHDITPDDLTLEAAVIVSNDTIPNRQSIVQRTENGKTVKLIYQNGEVAELKIDDKIIPSEQYGKHAALIQSLMEEAANIPPPPPPPPAPPAPDAESAEPPLPPPPPAPAPPKIRKKKTETTIIREKKANGEMMYRVESNGGAHQEIVIDSESGVAHFNGQKIIIDADSVIIIEEIETIESQDAPYGFNFEGLEWKDADGQAYLFKNKSDYNYTFNLDKEGLGKIMRLKGDSLKLENHDFNLLIDSLGNRAIWSHSFEEGLSPEDKQLFQYKWNQSHDQSQDVYFFHPGDQEDERREGPRDTEDHQRILRLKKEGAVGGNGYVIKTQPIYDNVVAYTTLSSRYDKDRMLVEMERDGLIDLDEDYSILLTEKKLKINGKKMSGETLEKYKKMFEKTHGYPIEGKTTIELSND